MNEDIEKLAYAIYWSCGNQPRLEAHWIALPTYLQDLYRNAARAAYNQLVADKVL